MSQQFDAAQRNLLELLEQLLPQLEKEGIEHNAIVTIAANTTYVGFQFLKHSLGVPDNKGFSIVMPKKLIRDIFKMLDAHLEVENALDTLHPLSVILFEDENGRPTGKVGAIVSADKEEMH